MGDWQITLQRFRALGGIADNVELREGVYGRGLFAIDPKQPVKISVPQNLLLPIDWLQLDAQGGLILSDDCDWSEEAKCFYLEYQSDFGIGAGIGSGLMQDMMQRQNQLIALPDSLKAMLMAYGVGDNFFHKPTVQTCLDMYKYSRRITVSDDKLVLMPILELLNHDELSKKSFHISAQVEVFGKFKDEILVHYGMAGDAALMYEVYGFSAPKPYAFSGALAIKVGNMVIKIARYVNLYNKIDKTNMPKLRLEGNEVHLSFLVLGSVNDKSSPKKIFTKLMHGVGMPAHIASDVFDGIVEQNKNFFLHLLEELKPLDGDTAEGLRRMAKNQLIPFGVRM